MDIVARLLRAVAADGSTTYECRHCGTTVSAGTDQCSSCGAEEIASYRF